MTMMCNKNLFKGNIPTDWKLSTLVLIYNGKDNPLNCGSNHAIKLLEQGVKILERVIECRLGEIVNIDVIQFGFMPGKVDY